MNICDLKNKSVFIPKGKIIPNWMLKISKGDKKGKHRVVSGGIYIYRHNGFMYWFNADDKQDYGIKVSGFNKTNFVLNPYGVKEARFLSGNKLNDFLKEIKND